MTAQGWRLGKMEEVLTVDKTLNYNTHVGLRIHVNYGDYNYGDPQWIIWWKFAREQNLNISPKKRKR